MRRLQLSILVSVALAVSCASHRPTTAARPLNVPKTAMERQIQNAIDAGDGDYELRGLRERVAREPANIEVRLDLAKAYRERGLPDLALEHYRLAAGRFPESAPVQLALARSLRDAGMRKQAADGLRAFLSAHPQPTPEYLSWLGIIRDEMGLWPEGETAHRSALELSPKSDYLHNNLGYNLLMQGKNEEAREQFRQALQANPQSLLSRNNLSLTLAHTEAKEQAIANWQAAAGPAAAHNNMAAYLIEQGRYAEARKELDIALGYNNQHTAALKNLALVSRLDGKPATMTLQPQTGTRWIRFKSGFRRLFVGPLDDRPAEAANTVASAQ